MPRPSRLYAVPDTALCSAVTELARLVSPPALFNHVQRTYHFAALLGRSARTCDFEALYIGSTLHDLGLVRDMPVQSDFEIDGADAARTFVLERGMDPKRADLVWQAIALHTTPGGSTGRPDEVALVQAGAAVDIGIIPLASIPRDFLDVVLEHLPRLEFKQVMIELLETRVRRTPEHITGVSVSQLAGRPLPCIRHLGLCDLIRRSAFES